MLQKPVSKLMKWLPYIACVLLVIVYYCINVEPLIGDAQDYYLLSQNFNKTDGNFSLLNFPDTMRGVSFALYLYVIDAFSNFLNFDIRYVVTVFNVLLLLITSILYIKIFCEDYTKSKKYFCWSALGVVVFFAVFARYGATTLLADLPSMCFAAIGASFLYYAYCQKTRAFYRLFSGFLAGFFLYTAYNFRTIYLFSIIIILFVFFIMMLVEKKYSFTLILLLCFLGIFVAGLPQAFLNENYSNVFTIKLFTEPSSDDVNLFVKQLFWGIEINRYDTYIFPLESGGLSGMGIRFEWPGAQNLLNLSPEYSLKGYLTMMITHPFYFISLYITHFLNMLSPYFKDVYILNLNEVKWPYLVAMFTVCYFVVWDILLKIESKSYTVKSLLNKRFLLSLVLIFPALAIVPGAVEQRFAIPLIFLIFIYFLCFCSFKKMWQKTKENPIGNIAIFCVVLACMFSFWITTLATAPMPICI